MSNRSPRFSPNNAYPCAGEDRWITISATNDQEWDRLARLIGGQALAVDPDYATNEARLAKQQELDKLIARWTVDRDAFQLTQRLQELGVPSSPVMRAPDLLDDPHYASRGTFVTVEHPKAGTHKYPGIPWKMSATPGEIHWASPTLGQHNRQIYGELLGLSVEQIETLQSQGAIGTKPTGSRII